MEWVWVPERDALTNGGKWILTSPLISSAARAWNTLEQKKITYGLKCTHRESLQEDGEAVVSTTVAIRKWERSRHGDLSLILDGGKEPRRHDLTEDQDPAMKFYE